MSEQLWAAPRIRPALTESEPTPNWVSEHTRSGRIPMLWSGDPKDHGFYGPAVPVTLIPTADLDAMRAEVERLRGLKGAASSAWHAIDARPEPGARIVVMDSDGGGATLFRVEADGRLRRADDETDDGGCWWEAVEESGWVWMRLPEGARLWFERGAELDALRRPERR